MRIVLVKLSKVKEVIDAIADIIGRCWLLKQVAIQILRMPKVSPGEEHLHVNISVTTRISTIQQILILRFDFPFVLYLRE